MNFERYMQSLYCSRLVAEGSAIEWLSLVYLQISCRLYKPNTREGSLTCIFHVVSWKWKYRLIDLTVLTNIQTPLAWLYTVQAQLGVEDRLTSRKIYFVYNLAQVKINAGVAFVYVRQAEFTTSAWQATIVFTIQVGNSHRWNPQEEWMAYLCKITFGVLSSGLVYILWHTNRAR